MDKFIDLNADNLEQEHLCCAISDKKHQLGVEKKKQWLKERFKEGHTFRKLDVKGKVFIEYAPLEKAWVPIVGNQFIYIYCLWVSGSFKQKGYGEKLLLSCIEEAKKNKKSGICILSSKKKKPFLSDKKFMLHYGFKVVDHIHEEYELLSLSFDGTQPSFSASVRKMKITNKELTIYYDAQCPFILNSIEQIEQYSKEHHIPLTLIAVDCLEKAKQMPCLFNNWAVFYEGEFKTVHLLNVNTLKKLLYK